MKKSFVVGLVILLVVPTIALASGYCAELGDGEKVMRVIVCNDLDWPRRNLGGRWVETYMGNPNHNYAGQGYTYHADKDNFSSPQPYPSWTLDNKLEWQSPVPMPNDGKLYQWDETARVWKEYGL